MWATAMKPYPASAVRKRITIQDSLCHCNPACNVRRPVGFAADGASYRFRVPQHDATVVAFSEIPAPSAFNANRPLAQNSHNILAFAKPAELLEHYVPVTVFRKIVKPVSFPATLPKICHGTMQTVQLPFQPADFHFIAVAVNEMFTHSNIPASVTSPNAAFASILTGSRLSETCTRV